MFLMRSVCLIFMLFIGSWVFAQGEGMSASGSVATHPQAQLWSLLEAGSVGAADQFEAELKNILETAAIEKVRALGGGLSESWLVRFSEHVFAVVKPADRQHPRSPYHEAAAYQMDRLLNLHMVPLTVVRMIDGKAHSLQIYYPASERFKLKPSLAVIDPVQIKDLQLFDAIIANQDRHIKDAHNALEGIEGRLVGFDHGRTFAADYQPYKLLTGGSLQVKQVLMTLNPQALSASLAHLLNPAELTSLSDRLLGIQQAASKLSWSPRAGSLAGSAMRLQVPSELSQKIFLEVSSLEKYFAKELQTNTFENLKSILLKNPDSDPLAKKLFFVWSSLSVAEKQNIFVAISAAAPKDPLIPAQIFRLAQQHPQDLVLMDKALGAEIKKTFAYSMFVHEVAAKTTSSQVHKLANNYLEGHHGRNVISRALYNLPQTMTTQYQELFLSTLQKYLKVGELKLQDLLSLSLGSQARLQDLISSSRQQQVVKSLLQSQSLSLDVERKEKADQFLEKIKGTVLAPLCRSIF